MCKIAEENDQRAIRNITQLSTTADATNSTKQ